MVVVVRRDGVGGCGDVKGGGKESDKGKNKTWVLGAVYKGFDAK